jgi:AraC-like DNA-binding protein
MEQSRESEQKLQLPRVHWAARTLAPAEGDRFADTTREINFAFVHEGEIRTHIGGCVLTAPADSLLIYPARARFEEEIRGGTRYGRVFFVPGSSGFDGSARVVALEPGEMAARWLDDLCALHEAHGAHRELSGPLLEAMLARLRHIEQRQATERALHIGVARAMKYLEENIEASPSLREVALHVHMSPSHLRELFRRQVGSSPSKYHNDLRMQRALRLLEQPHLSLGQVARACGFRDPEYFARRFRQYHHASPGQLRRRSKLPAEN